ncbi:hypothetical protein [Haloarcula amylolytica]|uniref:Uncharacterized protein n=1 Tax=Haloarcula amylolytica JCM 13557 TaxID=1227452 RepID=M0KST9_9EURY|nr:hypothetical protein [Haloarcula amylolytica]EMA23274.1 hypothetical protein C442_05901 [Haloarcula amylolytica JCM 13557]
MARKSQLANVVTMIPGYSENSKSGGRTTNSAIPGMWDDIFHGDNRRSLPSSLKAATTKNKSLEEYPSRTFPDYRVKTGLKLSFETNGKTISSPTVSQERDLAPITLEGERSKGRDLMANLDGSEGFLQANRKGPFFKKQEVNVGDVEGLRASLIFGGNDTYLVEAKKRGYTLSQLFPRARVPGNLANFYLTPPAFYAFLDVVFMADGAKIVRVWDASRYPAHALYLGDSQVDKPPFREGTEWTRDGKNPAFDEFVLDGTSPDRTPFRPFAQLGDRYRKTFDDGKGPHPVMEEAQGGSKLQAQTLESQFSSPMFPSPF